MLVVVLLHSFVACLQLVFNFGVRAVHAHTRRKIEKNRLLVCLKAGELERRRIIPSRASRVEEVVNTRRKKKRCKKGLTTGVCCMGEEASTRARRRQHSRSNRSKTPIMQRSAETTSPHLNLCASPSIAVGRRTPLRLPTSRCTLHAARCTLHAAQQAQHQTPRHPIPPADNRKTPPSHRVQSKHTHTLSPARASSPPPQRSGNRRSSPGALPPRAASPPPPACRGEIAAWEFRPCPLPPRRGA